MVNHEELAGWLRLTLTPGIGGASARKLLAAFARPANVFGQSQGALEQIVSSAQTQALLQEPVGFAARLEHTRQWLQGTEASGATRRVVTLGDAGYPASLLEMLDPPVLLYVLGAPTFELTQLEPSIAIVGSRNPTPQGESNARSFARALGDAGLCVVSGLALGIDGAAHQGALDAAGDKARLATVAVVGTGLDRVLTARQRELAHRICRHGLIVSEFPLGTAPLAQNFPNRNRVIAGLACGTLVVEAALSSGSLMTARLASEQGKEVFAIAGSIHSPQSRGCRALIRQGAKQVESVTDILQELPLSRTTVSIAHTAAQARVTPLNDPKEPWLLGELGFDRVSLDALAARTGYSVAALQVQLLELELEGRIARLPGGLFQRIGRG